MTAPRCSELLRRAAAPLASEFRRGQAWPMVARRMVFVLALSVLACAGGERGGSALGGASPAARDQTQEIVVATPPMATSLTEPLAPALPKQEEPEDEVRLCRFLHGQMLSCKSGYSGPIQVQDDGVWLSCRASAGRVTHCLGPGAGLVVVRDEAIFVQCETAGGSFGGCRGPFTGTAPLRRTPPRD